MIEYEVEIGERPLGVRFAHADRGETVVVHLVLENKVGHKLGLLPGDILIAVNGESVLEKTSSEALSAFRGQELPFKASFRRFEDDDDFDSDEEENSEEGVKATSDELNEQQEFVSHIAHTLSSVPTKHRGQSITTKQWDSNDVAEWLANYGRARFDDQDRFTKYQKLVLEKEITGQELLEFNKDDLIQLGVEENHAADLLYGIKQLKEIIFQDKGKKKKQGGIGAQFNNIISDENEEEEEDDSNEQESDNDDNYESKDNDNDDETSPWNQPFLPYMHDAPIIELTEKTKVEVYSARVVSPFKKKAFALYELEVKDPKEEWLLSKRYTEFYKLYEKMKKQGIKTKITFPKKGIFYKSTDKQVMEDRKKKLTAYLNELLKDHEKARKKGGDLYEFLSPSRTFVVDE